jgi:hypothetical protein
MLSMNCAFRVATEAEAFGLQNNKDVSQITRPYQGIRLFGSYSFCIVLTPTTSRSAIDAVTGADNQAIEPRIRRPFSNEFPLALFRGGRSPFRVLLLDMEKFRKGDD